MSRVRVNCIAQRNIHFLFTTDNSFTLECDAMKQEPWQELSAYCVDCWWKAENAEFHASIQPPSTGPLYHFKKAHAADVPTCKGNLRLIWPQPNTEVTE